MMAFVPAYRCGAVPEFHWIPFSAFNKCVTHQQQLQNSCFGLVRQTGSGFQPEGVLLVSAFRIHSKDALPINSPHLLSFLQCV